MSDSSHYVEFASSLGAALTGLLNVSPPHLLVADFNQPVVGIGAFQVGELRGSPHQVTLSQNS